MCHGAQILHECRHRVTLGALNDTNGHLNGRLTHNSDHLDLQSLFKFYSHLIEKYNFTVPIRCWHDSGIDRG